MKNSFRYLLVFILITSFSDCFADWRLSGESSAHIYYAENIMKGKVLEANCVKTQKSERERCIGTILFQKLYKGDAKLIGKVVRFDEEDYFSDLKFYKKDQESIFLFDKITDDGKLVRTSPQSGGFPSGIDVSKESDLEKILKEQNNPKYRPSLDPRTFYAIDPWISTEIVYAESVFVVKTTNVFNMFLHIDKILPILPCWYHHTVEIEKVLRGDKSLVGKKLLLNDRSSRNHRTEKCDLDFSENERSLLVFRKSDKKRDYSKMLKHEYYKEGVLNSFKGNTELGESFFKLCEKNPWYQPPKDARRPRGL